MKIKKVVESGFIHLSELEIQKIKDDTCDFEFEYGIVMFKHRFSLNTSINDYERTILNKCITVQLKLKYYNMVHDELIYELQVIYKDENNKTQCLKKSLKDWTFHILHKGDMGIII